MINDEEIQMRRAEYFEKFTNPKLFIKEENHYSVIGKVESEMSRSNTPFFRFKKRKDSAGEYVVYANRTKIYRERWIPITNKNA